MNVDTGEFRALTEQVAATGRRVSALSGRVTKMTGRLNRLGDLAEEDVHVLLRGLARYIDLAARDGHLPARPAPEHAAPQGRRHLHLVE